MEAPAVAGVDVPEAEEKRLRGKKGGVEGRELKLDVEGLGEVDEEE